MKLPNQDYKVIRHSNPFTSTRGKSEGKLTITIWFKGQSDRQDYKTHIVKGHENEIDWSTVMSQLDTKPTVRFDQGKMLTGNIINADSVPHIVSNMASGPELDIFNKEPEPAKPTPLTPDELRGCKAFVQHVEAYIDNPTLLEDARKAIQEQA